MRRCLSIEQYLAQQGIGNAGGYVLAQELRFVNTQGNRRIVPVLFVNCWHTNARAVGKVGIVIVALVPIRLLEDGLEGTATTRHPTEFTKRQSRANNAKRFESVPVHRRW